MRPSPTATGPSGPRRPAGETAGGEGADHLSALPDDLLRRIMSSLKAWEVVRTCVLARRWRHLWASAPCLDLRTRQSTRDRAPRRLRDFLYRIFLFRDASAPVDTLRLRSSDALGAFADDDASAWIRTAMNRGARVIHVVGHRRFPALFVGVPFVSCHLKVLKLSYARLDRRILGELSSRCTSLEELDLKDCLVAADEIVSASLKTLIMLKCKIECDFSIAAPNLVLLRLITPYLRVPSFKNLGSLVTGTILIDDCFLSDDISEDEEYDETTDDDDSVNYVSEHTIDQEDSDESTATDDDNDDDASDDNSNYGSEHIIEQEDCDETTSDDGDDDDSSYVSEHISYVSEQISYVSEHISYVPEHIIEQEDCDETTSDDGDDDDSSYVSEHISYVSEHISYVSEHVSYVSEHIIEQEDCDETTSDDGDDDDSSYASKHITDQDDCDETTDDDGDDSDDKDNRDKSYKAGDGSFLSGDDSVYISEDDVFAESADEEDGSDNSKNSKIGYGCGGQNDNYDHDNDIDSDDTYEYSEIAQERKYGYHSDSQNSSEDDCYHSYENSEINDSEYVGGQNILRSLSNVTSLGLLTDAGEVVLIRELKRCPTFSNLKTLSLGEWCMAPGFVALIFLLQHSPVIERLFLQLKLNFDTRSKKALKTSIKLQRRSFTCKDLQMVKIKCSKDDARVHKLANLFIANGVPLDKILVHRSGSACLPAQKVTDQAMHELMLFGPDWVSTKILKLLDRSSLV